MGSCRTASWTSLSDLDYWKCKAPLGFNNLKHNKQLKSIEKELFHFRNSISLTHWDIILNEFLVGYGSGLLISKPDLLRNNLDEDVLLKP